MDFFEEMKRERQRERVPFGGGEGSRGTSLREGRRVRVLGFECCSCSLSLVFSSASSLGVGLDGGFFLSAGAVEGRLTARGGIL